MVEYRNKHNVRSEEDLETLASGEGSHYDKSDYAFVSKRDPIADYICKTYVQMQSDVRVKFFIERDRIYCLYELDHVHHLQHVAARLDSRERNRA